MSPGRYTGHNDRVSIFAIDKQPVTMYVAFAASFKFAVKRVIFARGGEAECQREEAKSASSFLKDQGLA